MTVVLTSPVEGKQPGDTYTGADEAWLLASGYARKQAGPFTGPGLDNTGPSDTTIANNREFTPVDHQIAATSDLPEGGTNDGIVLKDADAPLVTMTGNSGAPVYPVDDPDWDGFANDPTPTTP
jgi:hypothetical protein